MDVVVVVVGWDGWIDGSFEFAYSLRRMKERKMTSAQRGRRNNALIQFEFHHLRRLHLLDVRIIFTVQNVRAAPMRRGPIPSFFG